MATQKPSSSFQSTGFKGFSLPAKKPTFVPISVLDRLDSDDEEISEPEATISNVIHFEDGVMVTDEVKSNGPLIIPRVIGKDWRLKQLQEKEDNGTLTEEERARLALMLEAGGQNECFTLLYKLIIDNIFQSQNSIIQPINIDNDYDENPDDPDYSQVPIESFGMAVLRGYGFKEGDGIGKTNKKAVVMKLQKRRPQNLGLGADENVLKSKIDKISKEKKVK